MGDMLHQLHAKCDKAGAADAFLHDAKAAAEAAHTALYAALKVHGSEFVQASHYVTFKSSLLGGYVRIGYEWDDGQDHAFSPQSAGAEMTEVWIGGIDIGQHLTGDATGRLQVELRDAITRAWP